MRDPNDRFHVGQARFAARSSKDPSTKTGCVIVRDGMVVGSGFNKFPRGVRRTDARDEDRETRLAMTVHAESYALLMAGQYAIGATVYVWPWPPCAPCTALLIEAGVHRVVSPAPTEAQRQRWGKSFDIARYMCEEAGVWLQTINYDNEGDPSDT